MKRFVFLSAAIILLLYSHLVHAGAYKIGFVDLQRALNDCIAGKEAKEKFAKEVKKVEAEIMKQKEELDKLRETLDKQSMMLTREVRQEKEKDYLRKQRDYDRKVKDSKDELQIKDAELTRNILESLVSVVNKFGKENNYDFIFEKSETVLLFASDTHDLTDKIIEIYDIQYQTKKQK